jgi:tRNA A-37 threonylcarbamoyl transferase component Bud32
MAHRKGARLAQGSTAEVYEWEDDKVVKLFFPGFSYDYVQYEYDINCQAAETGLPVPKVYQQLELDGRRGIVFERIVEPLMLDMMFTQAGSVEDLATAFADAHARIHETRVSGFPLLRAGLSDVIGSSTWIDDSQRARVLRILRELPEGDTLVHGDYHPGNVAMSARGAIVLDWLTAKQDNPHADVANTVMILRCAGVPSDDPSVVELVNAVRGAFLHTYQQRYLELRPETRWEQVERWMIPLIVGRLALNREDERKNLLRELASLLDAY